MDEKNDNYVIDRGGAQFSEKASAQRLSQVITRCSAIHKTE